MRSLAKAANQETKAETNAIGRSTRTEGRNVNAGVVHEQ